jgi:ADP-heptose:LPS heptosyltransferase
MPVEVLRRVETLESKGGLVVVHAGSTSRYKLWETEKVADLIMRLGGDQDLSFVLVGSRGERQLAEQVLARARLAGRILSLTGGLTVAQTAAVISRAKLFVGGDSGLAHVAVALRTPTVVWFGPSDSRKWGRIGPRHAIVTRPLACAPCFIFGYHKLCRQVACMRGISVDDVFTACRTVLAASTGPA